MSPTIFVLPQEPGPGDEIIFGPVLVGIFLISGRAAEVEEEAEEVLAVFLGGESNRSRIASFPSHRVDPGLSSISPSIPSTKEELISVEHHLLPEQSRDVRISSLTSRLIQSFLTTDQAGLPSSAIPLRCGCSLPFLRLSP